MKREKCIKLIKIGESSYKILNEMKILETEPIGDVVKRILDEYKKKV